MANAGQTTRLCIVMTAEAGEATADRLAAALSAADIASVILTAPAGRVLEAGIAVPLVAMAQKAGAAALIAGDARLARTIKADGVHLSPADSYTDARETVGRGLIVGADAASSRHDAMELGEVGADYVAFGIHTPGKDEVPVSDAEARELRLELVRWWSEIFEPPCLALDVASAEEAAALAEAGADFVAVALPAGTAIADVRALVQSFADAVALSEPAR